MELVDTVKTVNPREFNGQFFFTNPDTEDFTAFWNGTAYTFPAMTTNPLLIVDATPAETQSIRKQFATNLARRMFGKSKRYKHFDNKKNGATPMSYDETIELAPFIQKCLEPLPVAQPKVSRAKRSEPEQKIDPATGEPVIKVLGEKENGAVSLKR